MNVYDFDGTIYDGDSSVDFYMFCLRKHPMIIRFLPRQLLNMLKWKLGIISLTEMKTNFFCFLRGLEEINNLTHVFWKENKRKIKAWYLNIKKDDDLVITASPEFLITTICVELNIQSPIATIIDLKTGVITGNNCKGEEKRRRYLERFPYEKIENFYSDSISDFPIAEMATNSYFVNGKRIFKWPTRT